MTTATTEKEATIQIAPIKTSAAIQHNAKVVDLTQQAKALTIGNQEQLESAASVLKNIKKMADTLEVARKAITKPLDEAKQAVMDLFRTPSDSLKVAEKQVKDKMLAYTNEQERIREAEEARLQREADKKASKEKERLETRAAKAESSGKIEKAEELRQQAEEVQAVAPVLAPTVEKVSGISTRTIWKAEVVDISLVPREYMVADTSMLDKVAKATKGSLTIPGVKFYSEKSLAA